MSGVDPAILVNLILTKVSVASRFLGDGDAVVANRAVEDEGLGSLVKYLPSLPVRGGGGEHCGGKSGGGVHSGTNQLVREGCLGIFPSR